jgi:hypothetical protein
MRQFQFAAPDHRRNVTRDGAVSGIAGNRAMATAAYYTPPQELQAHSGGILIFSTTRVGQHLQHLARHRVGIAEPPRQPAAACIPRG